MALSIIAFGYAYALGTGDTLAFAVICLASGAALGADMTLLPALFARRMEVISPSGAEAFGLWTFVSKLTLAFAAVTLLPVLDGVGFVSGGPNDEAALATLSLLYAAVPCVLKLLAVAVLYATPIHDEDR